MSKELQDVLKPGDQIIATKEAFFDYSEEVKAKKLYSQQPGDIIMVNNPRQGQDIVSGTALNGVAYNGRACLGLGGSLKVGAFRMATPDDPGYMATKEQWRDFKDKKIEDLERTLKWTVGSYICMLSIAVILTCVLLTR